MMQHYEASIHSSHSRSIKKHQASQNLNDSKCSTTETAQVVHPNFCAAKPSGNGLVFLEASLVFLHWYE